MRCTILKRNSTKAERRLAEQLKNSHIPFRHRVKILGYECDFLIGNLIVEVGNHKGNPEKNAKLLSAGYSLYTIHNSEAKNIINQIKNIWQQSEKEQVDTM